MRLDIVVNRNNPDKISSYTFNNLGDLFNCPVKDYYAVKPNDIVMLHAPDMVTKGAGDFIYIGQIDTKGYKFLTLKSYRIAPSTYHSVTADFGYLGNRWKTTSKKYLVSDIRSGAITLRVLHESK